MKRGGRLRSDPEKQRAWQARGVARYEERRRERAEESGGPGRLLAQVFPRRSAVSPSPSSRAAEGSSRGVSSKRRRNDSGWRAEVMARYGPSCVACGDRCDVQADHMVPRSQGGPSVVENGLPLCGPFSVNTPGGCHAAKTDSRMLIRPEWLRREQIDFLADAGWVAWGEDGQPRGRGWRHFAPRKGGVEDG